MAQFLKPSNLNNVWASGGDRIYPGDTKYSTGWQVEIPPRQYFNEIDYKQDQMLAHLNQHGIPVWDSETEYQSGKSYVQGVAGGVIYLCIQTHTNQNPELDVAGLYWQLLPSSRLSYDNTISGLVSSNVQEAVDEVAGKIEQATETTAGVVEMATNAETVAGLLTSLATHPAGVKAALTAFLPKRSFGSADFIRIPDVPGGLIIQWADYSQSAQNEVMTLPTPFPNAHLITIPVDNAVASTGTSGPHAIGIGIKTNTTFTVFSRDETAGSFAAISIGY